jgi:hypothetical protein
MEMILNQDAKGCYAKAPTLSDAEQAKVREYLEVCELSPADAERFVKNWGDTTIKKGETVAILPFTIRRNGVPQKTVRNKAGLEAVPGPKWRWIKYRRD